MSKVSRAEGATSGPLPHDQENGSAAPDGCHSGDKIILPAFDYCVTCDQI